MYYENLSEEQGEHNIFYVILRSLKKGFILKIKRNYIYLFNYLFISS